ncbi:MAG: GAF domain-containing sensor histidine kinase [Chloroflexota bacterium]
MPQLSQKPLSVRLANLTELLISFAASPVPSHFFQTMADYGRMVMDFDYLGIALVDPSEIGFILHTLDSSLTDTPATFNPAPLGEDLISETIQTGRVKKGVWAEGSSDKQFEQFRAQHQLTNHLFVPLMQGERKLGCAVFAATEATSFSDEDEQIGVLLCAGLSANIEMSRLYQTLSDERSTLTALLESTKDGFLVVDPDGQILVANPAFLAMFEVNTDSLVLGKQMFDLFSDSSIPSLFANDAEDEAELKLADGRCVQATRQAVQSGFGEHLGWSVVFHDITLLKELVDMKTDFVNIVAHDLKNPIASIRMAADLIPRLGDTNDRQKDMHGRIVRTSNYMKDLVTELLDIGQLESNTGLNVVPIDLATELEDIVFSLKTNAEVKQIVVLTDLPTGCEIKADSGRLRQLFLNLIGNAIKYTPNEGEVEVRLTNSDDKLVEVCVKDNGLGIPAADLPHIFEKFYRVRTEDRTQIKGTGLGLAISKSIVDAHSGEISVTSQPGEGTAFTVKLPIDQLA